MIFKQYYLGCLAHASYLIGDEETQTAIVVDPQRDVQQYLDDAIKYDLKIRHVFLTHFHADFVAGHLELRDQVGAEIHLGAKAEAEFKFTPEKDGNRLEIGSMRLEFLETPGHTPEGLSILVFDLKENTEKPKMVLTGDTLFIGDVGRPDLMASEGVSEHELAAMLYDSLREKLMQLPEETLVYPAHGAGSLCGKKLSEETVSTLGQQLAWNYALQPMSREEFIALVTENQPQAPTYFSYDARLNKKERQNLDQSLEASLTPLTLEEFLEKQRAGLQVLDTRPEGDYNAAHLKGAIQVGLGGKFATWAGIVLSHEIPIIIIAEPGTEYESRMRLGRIGFDRVDGYLKEGMEALEHRPELLESTASWTAQEFLDNLEGGLAPLILDVQSPGEFQEHHIKDAVNIPLNDLKQRMKEIPQGKPILVHCAGGYRSAIACSLLQKEGYANVINLIGGMGALGQLNSATVFQKTNG
jgi:hydroxyacylglutathione hydrolase